MPTLVELAIPPEYRYNRELLYKEAAARCGVEPRQLKHVELVKVSLDARSRAPVLRIRAEVYHTNESFVPEAPVLAGFRPVESGPEVIVVGAGPAGYFAALELLEQGIRPIVLDRGQDARTRRRDLRAIQQFGVVNPHSNYCFGEGGAGTYSDGKLYTRSVKRGNMQKALRLLVEHGASPDILVEAHPHIGSNKLPGVVQQMRATIEHYGGRVLFGRHMTGLMMRGGRVVGVQTEAAPSPHPEAPLQPDTTEVWMGEAVVLATGHSARDVYHLLHRQGLRLEAKPFALGVRVEHPQHVVDQAQYHRAERGEHLPPASYSLVCQVGDRGVFSFCMCPGGLIVPAATAPGEIVVNGMSMSRRDSPYANSGLVTAVELSDLAPWSKHGVFAAMQFQQEVEQTLFAAGDGSQRAPAMRLTDFMSDKCSLDLPATSYIPGIYAAPLYALMPSFIVRRLKAGLKDFGAKMRGFYSEEAIVVGTESRSSAPVRIPRNSDTYQHPDAPGLFPCGEGAGYAGGILSAAMDGQNTAKKVALWVKASK
jgi:uncharacterized FAD-dependent dehydrogenase